MSTQALTPTATLALSSDPTIPTVRVGDLYFNTGTGKLRVYGTSSAWVDVATSSGGGTPATTVVASNFFSQGSAVGTSTNYAREDHVHGTPAFPTDMMTTDTTQTGLTGDKTSSGIWTAGALSAAGLTGATAASRYAGAVAGAAPSTGTFAVGDFVVSQQGLLHVCITAGSPGTWASLLTSANISQNLGSGGKTFTGTVSVGSLSCGATITLAGTNGFNGAFFSPSSNGATAATRYVGGTTTGSPTGATFTLGDWVVSQDGHVYICTATGFPGTWVDVTASAMTTSSNQAGLTGNKTSSGIWTAGVLSAAGLTGATSATRYVGGVATGAPTSGTFVTGDWVVARDGRQWICTTGGTPGTWVDAGAVATNVVTSTLTTASKLTDASSAPSSPAVGDLWVDTTTSSGALMAVVPVGFAVAGALTTGVKKPRFIFPVDATLRGARALVDTGASATYRIVWTTAAGVATNLATSSAVGTTSSLNNFADQDVSAGDSIQVEVVAAGTGVDLSVTVDAVMR